MARWMATGLIVLAAGGCATAGEDGYLLATNEPFRSVEVRGARIVYRGVEIGDAPRTYDMTGRRAMADNAIDWRGQAGESEILFTIRPGPCEDDMSAQRYPLRATITIDGSTATGCARRLSDPVPIVPGE